MPIRFCNRWSATMPNTGVRRLSNPLMQSLVIDDQTEADVGGSKFAFLKVDGGSIDEDAAP